MSVLSTEFRNVQNPALGATLLWRFACGHFAGHRTKDAVPLSLAFLVLPIVLHQQTEEFVKTTIKSSGLRAFAGKFGTASNAKQDVLLAINGRMIAHRTLTMESLRIAMSTQLVHVSKEARISPLSMTSMRSGIPLEIKRLHASSEKLGFWFSQLTVHEIASALKVRF